MTFSFSRILIGLQVGIGAFTAKICQIGSSPESLFFFRLY